MSGFVTFLLIIGGLFFAGYFLMNIGANSDSESDGND